MTRIEICLGSSCFARGGSRFPAVVAEWLSAHGATAEVRGRRCEKACEHGPTVLVDGVAHRVADEEALCRLLAEACSLHHA